MNKIKCKKIHKADYESRDIVDYLRENLEKKRKKLKIVVKDIGAK